MSRPVVDRAHREALTMAALVFCEDEACSDHRETRDALARCQDPAIDVEVVPAVAHHDSAKRGRARDLPPSNFVLLLDCGDLPLDGSLRALVQALDPDAEVAVARRRDLTRERWAAIGPDERPTQDLLALRAISRKGVLLRRSLWDEVVAPGKSALGGLDGEGAARALIARRPSTVDAPRAVLVTPGSPADRWVGKPEALSTFVDTLRVVWSPNAIRHEPALALAIAREMADRATSSGPGAKLMSDFHLAAIIDTLRSSSQHVGNDLWCALASVYFRARGHGAAADGLLDLARYGTDRERGLADLQAWIELLTNERMLRETVPRDVHAYLMSDLRRCLRSTSSHPLWTTAASLARSSVALEVASVPEIEDASAAGTVSTRQAWISARVRAGVLVVGVSGAGMRYELALFSEASGTVYAAAREQRGPLHSFAEFETSLLPLHERLWVVDTQAARPRSILGVSSVPAYRRWSRVIIDREEGSVVVTRRRGWLARMPGVFRRFACAGYRRLRRSSR